MMAALMLFVAPRAMACPLCANSLQLTISAQELIYAEHSVLAMPVTDRNEFQVVALIKGDAHRYTELISPDGHLKSSG